MPLLHENPAKLFRGDNEFCDAFDWVQVGHVSDTAVTFGHLTTLPKTRTVWKMLCDREPHVRGINDHSLRRGSHRIQVEIESAETVEIEGRRYSLVVFTTASEAEFPRE